MGLIGYVRTFINSGIVFPLSLLTSPGNYLAMVTFQAFSIAAVGPAVRQHLDSNGGRKDLQLHNLDHLG